MSRQLLRFAVLFAAILLAAACRREAPASGPQRPNILVVLLDDLRWDALGYAGHPHVKTPHIDRLANEGVYFKNAFCTTSLCSPSRASILSGLYAHAHGVMNNFTEYPDDAAELSPQRCSRPATPPPTSASITWARRTTSKRPGFDYFVTHKGQGKYFDTEFNVDGERRRWCTGYYTHVVTDLAVDWLKRDRGDKPWLLMLGHKAPHSFYFPGAEVRARVRRRASRVPGDGVPAGRQAGVDQRPARHVARDLRPAVRVAQEVSRRLARGREGFRGA